jgi:DNA (cytosine-5)-methyltransferase 1
MGIAPNWEYVNGANRIVFIPRKKSPSTMQQFIVCIFAALICGFLCLLIPNDIRIGLNTYGVAPLMKTFMGLLSAISGPLIFFSITWGIYSIGDTTTFSTVGKRDVNDPRNHLYTEYCRIVETIKPDFFVLENVKGLLTLSGGAFRDDIHLRFESLGYTVTHKLLNAADFGIPQNRQRVFFIGMKDKKFIFPKEHETILTCSDALSDMPDINEENGMADFMQYTKEPCNEYQRYLRNGSVGIKNNQITIHSEQTKSIIGMIKDGGKIKDLPPEYWDIRKYNKAFERMSSIRPSNTVDTGHRNYFHYSENRIPTARENARLQSFPDSFEFLGTKGSQYKQIGNAVPPLLAKAIAVEIMKQLGER